MSACRDPHAKEVASEALSILRRFYSPEEMLQGERIDRTVASVLRARGVPEDMAPKYAAAVRSVIAEVARRSGVKRAEFKEGGENLIALSRHGGYEWKLGTLVKRGSTDRAALIRKGAKVVDLVERRRQEIRDKIAHEVKSLSEYLKRIEGFVPMSDMTAADIIASEDVPKEIRDALAARMKAVLDAKKKLATLQNATPRKKRTEAYKQQIAQAKAAVKRAEKELEIARKAAVRNSVEEEWLRALNTPDISNATRRALERRGNRIKELEQQLKALDDDAVKSELIDAVLSVGGRPSVAWNVFLAHHSPHEVLRALQGYTVTRKVTREVEAKKTTVVNIETGEEIEVEQPSGRKTKTEIQQVQISRERAFREFMIDAYGLTEIEASKKEGESFEEYVHRMVRMAAARIIKSSQADIIVAHSDAIVLNPAALGGYVSRDMSDTESRQIAVEEIISKRAGKPVNEMSSSEIRRTYENELGATAHKAWGLSKKEAELLASTLDITRSDKEIRAARIRARERVVSDLSANFEDIKEQITDLIKAKVSGDMEEYYNKYTEKLYRGWKISDKERAGDINQARKAVEAETKALLKQIPERLFKKKVKDPESHEKEIGATALRIIAGEISSRDSFIVQEIEMLRKAYKESNTNQKDSALAAEMATKVDMTAEEVLYLLESPLRYAIAGEDITFGSAEGYRGVHMSHSFVDSPMRLYRVMQGFERSLKNARITVQRATLDDGTVVFDAIFSADPGSPWEEMDGEIIGTASTPEMAKIFALAGLHRRIFQSAAQLGIRGRALETIVGEPEESDIVGSAISDILLHDNFEFAMFRLARAAYLNPNNTDAIELYTRLYAQLPSTVAIYYPAPATLTQDPGNFVSLLNQKLAMLSDTARADTILTDPADGDVDVESYHGTLHAVRLEKGLNEILKRVATVAPASWERESYNLNEFLTDITQYIEGFDQELGQKIARKYTYIDDEGNIRWKESLIDALYQHGRFGEKAYMYSPTSALIEELALGDVVFVVRETGSRLERIGGEADDIAMAASGLITEEFLSQPSSEIGEMRKVQEVVFALAREVAELSGGDVGLRDVAGKYKPSMEAIEIMRSMGWVDPEDAHSMANADDMSISDVEKLIRAKVGRKASTMIENDLARNVDAIRNAIREVDAEIQRVHDKVISELQAEGKLPDTLVEDKLKEGEEKKGDLVRLVESEDGGFEIVVIEPEAEAKKDDEEKTPFEKEPEQKPKNIPKWLENANVKITARKESQEEVKPDAKDTIEYRLATNEEYQRLLNAKSKLTGYIRRLEYLRSMIGTNSEGLANAARKGLNTQKNERLAEYDSRMKRVMSDINAGRSDMPAKAREAMKDVRILGLDEYFKQAFDAQRKARQNTVDMLAAVADLVKHDTFMVKMSQKKTLTEEDVTLIRMRAVQMLSLLNSAVRSKTISRESLLDASKRVEAVSAIAPHLNAWVVAGPSVHHMKTKVEVSGQARSTAASKNKGDKGKKYIKTSIVLRSLHNPNVTMSVEAPTMDMEAKPEKVVNTGLKFIHPIVISNEGGQTVLRVRNLLSEAIEKMTGGPAQPMIYPGANNVHTHVYSAMFNALSEGRLHEVVSEARKAPKSILGAAIREAADLVSDVYKSRYRAFSEGSGGLEKLRDIFGDEATIQSLIFTGNVKYDFEAGVAYVTPEEGGKPERIKATAEQAMLLRMLRNRLSSVVADYAKAAAISKNIADAVGGVTTDVRFC